MKVPAEQLLKIRAITHISGAELPGTRKIFPENTNLNGYFLTEGYSRREGPWLQGADFRLAADREWMRTGITGKECWYMRTLSNLAVS